MKFIHKDLLSLLEKNPSKSELSNRLFQLGHEHEIDGDIFDMELTPNRGDCLSLLGLARDLNIFFGMKDLKNIYEDDIEDLELDFENLSPNYCPKISFLEIEIERKVSTYQKYLENYFSLMGNKKINFFTDISNYISYEQGQPTHCFDKDKINKKLIFENKSCDQGFKTLLGDEIRIFGENCIFRLNDEIVSLAGIMGGMSTSCSQETRKVLVECAFFIPEAIIGKSIKYNLSSDAAHRFERGVDLASQERVLRRFIQIVNDHTPIKSVKIKSFMNDSIKNISLPINVNKINKILGTNLEERDYLAYLNKLGFIENGKINVPSFRHDISSQNDLAEEIARVLGYDNIESQSFEIKNKYDKKIRNTNKIKHFLVNNGFSEVINFPFSMKKEKKSISIDNPLDSNKGFIRTSLKESLLNNLIYNERRQNDSIKLFEISNIYTKGSGIKEEKKLGIIISGRRGHNFKDFSKKLDNKYLEEVLDPVLNNLVFNIEEISRSEIKTKRKEKIFYTEILLDDTFVDLFEKNRLNKEQINFVKHQPVSNFPSSARDFSFLIADVKEYPKVLNHISNLNEENLKSSYIFDFYENKENSEVKIGVRLIFQSSFKTLSEEEIQKSINKILKPIVQLEGVSVPGL